LNYCWLSFSFHFSFLRWASLGGLEFSSLKFSSVFGCELSDNRVSRLATTVREANLHNRGSNKNNPYLFQAALQREADSHGSNPRVRAEFEHGIAGCLTTEHIDWHGKKNQLKLVL